MNSWRASQRREMCAPRRADAQGGKTVGPKWLRRIPERALRRVMGRRGRGSRLRLGRSARAEAKLAGDERFQSEAPVFIAVVPAKLGGEVEAFVIVDFEEIAAVQIGRAKISAAKIYEFADVELPSGSGSAVRKISAENVPVPISSRERKLSRFASADLKRANENLHKTPILEGRKRSGYAADRA